MRYLVAITLLFFIALGVTSSQAADIRCAPDGHYGLSQKDEWFLRRWPSGVRPSKSTCSTGFISGEIMQGDYEKVVALYRKNHPFMYGFSLVSRGGNVIEAIKIGRFFRKYLLTAEAPMHFMISDTDVFMNPDLPECKGESCVCASACALIWFGAVERAGSVGLHRPRTDDPYFRALGPNAAAASYQKILDSVRQYLVEMETPKPVIEEMLSTSSADIRWVDKIDDITRPPSLAEWEDSNCGGFSTKDQELLSDLRGRFADERTKNDSKILTSLENRNTSWFECQIDLLSSHRDQLPSP